VSDAVEGTKTPSTASSAALPRPVGRPRLGWRLWKLPAHHPSADVEIVAALLGGIAWLVLGLVPLQSVVPWLGTCEFHEVTGQPCPTCGVTRGVLELAAGHPLEALRMNPLVIGGLMAGLAYTPFAWWMWLGRRPRWRVLSTSRRARVAWLIAGVAVLLSNWVFLAIDGR
jgi:hypothetical protein